MSTPTPGYPDPRCADMSVAAFDDGTGTIKIVTPATPLPVSYVLDNTGVSFSPDSCSHVYGYNSAGMMITDTANDGAVLRVKSFIYVAGMLTGETKWVRQ